MDTYLPIEHTTKTDWTRWIGQADWSLRFMHIMRQLIYLRSVQKYVLAKVPIRLDIARSDLSVCCLHEDTMDTYLPIEQTTKTLIRQDGLARRTGFFALYTS